MKTQTLGGMNRTVHNLKIELESIKETQTERNLEMKYLKTWTETSETSLINRIQDTKERISSTEDMTEEMDISVKENVKFKKFLTQDS